MQIFGLLEGELPTIGSPQHLQNLKLIGLERKLVLLTTNDSNNATRRLRQDSGKNSARRIPGPTEFFRPRSPSLGMRLVVVVPETAGLVHVLDPDGLFGALNVAIAEKHIGISVVPIADAGSIKRRDDIGE